jgi:hypothetical protein
MFGTGLSNRGTAPRRVRLQVETLEDRCTPSASTYVTGLFERVLARAPSMAEMNFWVGQLNAGMTTMAVSETLTHSLEYYNDVANQTYMQFLHRRGSTAETMFWANQMMAGMSIDSLQATIASSAEALAINGSNVGTWVMGTYRDALGRTPSMMELNAWLGEIGAGASLQSVAGAIVGSTEHHLDLVSAGYVSMLRRQPDAGAAFAWANLLNNGLPRQEFIADLGASPEFQAMFQFSHA